MPRVNSGQQPMRHKSNTFHTDLSHAVYLILAFEYLFNIQFFFKACNGHGILSGCLPACGPRCWFTLQPPVTLIRIKRDGWMDGIFFSRQYVLKNPQMSLKTFENNKKKHRLLPLSDVNRTCRKSAEVCYE